MRARRIFSSLWLVRSSHLIVTVLFLYDSDFSLRFTLYTNQPNNIEQKRFVITNSTPEHTRERWREKKNTTQRNIFVKNFRWWREQLFNDSFFFLSLCCWINPLENHSHTWCLFIFFCFSTGFRLKFPFNESLGILSLACFDRAPRNFREIARIVCVYTMPARTELDKLKSVQSEKIDGFHRISQL